MKISTNNFRTLVVLLWALLFSVLFVKNSFTNGTVLSATSPWTQTDWSGGVAAGTVDTTVNTFSSAENINVGTTGEISLSGGGGYAKFKGNQLSTASTNFNVASLTSVRLNTSQFFDDQYFSYDPAFPTRMNVEVDGDYLFALTLDLNSDDVEDSSNRSGTNAYVYVNGSKADVGGARSTYLRNLNAHHESSGHLSVLLEGLNAGDYIEVFVVKSTNDSSHILTANLSAFIEYVATEEQIFAATSTSSQSGSDLSASESPMLWDQNIVDTGFTHTDGQSGVGLDEAGFYQVYVNIPLGSSSQRANVEGKIKLNNNLVNGGEFKQGYIRNASSHTTASIHWNGVIETTNPSESLTITVEEEGQTANVNVDGEKATLFIRKIDTTGLYLAEATQAGGSNNWNPSSESLINWGTDLEIDEDYFGHNTSANNDVITINKDGDYLLSFNAAYTSNGQRVNPKIKVYVNSSEVIGATTKSAYIRNGSAHNESSDTLLFLLTELVEGDEVTLTVQAETSVGDTTSLTGTSARLALEFLGYPDQGNLVSNVLDTTDDSDWGQLIYSNSGGGAVQVKVRTDSNDDMSTAGDWSTCGAIASGSDLTATDCVNDNTHFLQYQIVLEPDGFSTPVFQDLSVFFTPSDIVAPTLNASDISITNLSGDGDWHKDEPIITWTAGQDNAGGNGLLGYCIALDEAEIDTSSSLDPASSGGALNGVDDGITQDFCPFIATGTELDASNLDGLELISGKQYYVSIKAVDLSGNLYTGSSETWQDLISFKYDAEAPTPPFYVSLPVNFLASKNVVITWPVGTGGADDEHSGLAGLQYRIGSEGTWYGDLHTGTEDMNDLLTNDGSYTTDPAYDYPELSEGTNVIFFRAVDNVGNYTDEADYIKGILKLNTVAPSPVRNLQVSPTSNTTNSYAFSWDAPSTFTGSASAITYCYTVNTIPSANTCVFTQAGITELSADAFATQPGTNTMYVVAKDEAGNVNYATYSEAGSSVEFSYAGSAPGIASNLDLADISVKATQNWRLVVSWDEPNNIGAGIAYYNVYRSEISTSCNSGFSEFTKVGSSNSTSYIDPDLEQQEYYYCVKACDSANNCSASSETASRTPTGKFTEPALLVDEPVVETVTTRRALINWSTDRVSDSRIEYGLESDKYFEEEVSNSNQVIAHSISLNNLTPGTTYFYRAKWTDIDGNTGVSDEKSFQTLPPPAVSNVSTSSITTNTAVIRFEIENATRANILYGTTENYGGNQEIATSTERSSQAITLTGLQDGTQYNYKFILRDIDGNDNDTVVNFQFQTLPLPVIDNLRFEEVRNVSKPTVDITWNTNVDTIGFITYVSEDDPDAELTLAESQFKKKHKLTLEGLKADTVYELTVTSRDRLGNTVDSPSSSFTTATDSRPPVISNVKLETRLAEGSTDIGEDAYAQIVVTWDTDELATSQVQYLQGTGNDYTQKTPLDENLTFNHIVVINNLSPSSVYKLQVLSQDSAGNEGEGRSLVTISAQVQENPLELILSRLGEVFAFVR